MKCVCVTECQAVTNEGHIKYFNVGQVATFKKCPPHFEPIEGKKARKVNFETASEEELSEANFAIQELKDFIETKYQRRTGNRGRERLIAMLLDCRFRELDVPPNNMV